MPGCSEVFPLSKVALSQAHEGERLNKLRVRSTNPHTSTFTYLPAPAI
jgi:hypothetical protein